MLSPLIRWGNSGRPFDVAAYFPWFLWRKRSRHDDVAPRSPEYSERPSWWTGNHIWHRHPPCLVAGRSGNCPPILDHGKSYPSGVHAILSIVRLKCALFYAVLYWSGVATPPSRDPNHQHDFPKTPRDGTIHNYVFILDVHIVGPFNPG